MKWEDVIMRMRPKNGERERSMAVDSRTLNTRIFVKREAFAILSWGSKPGKAKDEIRTKLNDRVAPSDYPNSSRGITPGLINPSGPDTPRNRVPLPNKTIEDQTEEKQVTIVATADEDAVSDDGDSGSATVVMPRSEIDIAADRLLIVATKGPRVLEPGASANFEDYSPVTSSGDEIAN